MVLYVAGGPIEMLHVNGVTLISKLISPHNELHTS